MSRILGKSRLARLAQRFHRARTGSVVMTTGIMFPMILVAAGGALDYANAVKTTHKAQRAMDAAVLSLASRDVGEPDLQAEGEKVLDGLLAARGLKTRAAEVKFAKMGSAVRGSAMMFSDTSFLGLIGLNEIRGAVNSTAAPPGSRPIEISLVLDVSGSMENDIDNKKDVPVSKQRITLLKNAVNGMLDKLETDLPASADVSVALVPYSTSVNLRNLPRHLLEPASIGGSPAPSLGDDVLAAERYSSTDGTNYAVGDVSASVRSIPFANPGEFDISSDAAPNRLIPLTKNLATVRTAVKGMSPKGWTAGHVGMAWGIYTLSESWADVWPLAPKPRGGAEKVIVIVSDGAYTQSLRLDGIPVTNKVHVPSTYNYFEDVCDLAETKGIVVYAVALNLKATYQAKLNDCIANGGKLYPANTASDLSKAFEDIAGRVGKLRLTS